MLAHETASKRLDEPTCPNLPRHDRIRNISTPHLLGLNSPSLSLLTLTDLNHSDWQIGLG